MVAKHQVCAIKHLWVPVEHLPWILCVVVCEGRDEVVADLSMPRVASTLGRHGGGIVKGVGVVASRVQLLSLVGLVV